MNRYFFKTAGEMLHNLVWYPRRVLNQVQGRGYAKQFVRGEHCIRRPAQFWSDGTRQAFDLLGHRVCHEFRGDVINWNEPFLTLHPGMTWTDWDQVLEYFVQEGWLERRWVLFLNYRTPEPTSYDHMRVYCSAHGGGHYRIGSEKVFVVPLHAPDGTPLSLPSRDQYVTHALVHQVEFWPAYLTQVQKDSLLGNPYRTFVNRDYGFQDAYPSQEMIVTDRDLRTKYVCVF